MRIAHPVRPWGLALVLLACAGRCRPARSSPSCSTRPPARRWPACGRRTSSGSGRSPAISGGPRVSPRTAGNSWCPSRPTIGRRTPWPTAAPSRCPTAYSSTGCCRAGRTDRRPGGGPAVGPGGEGEAGLDGGGGHRLRRRAGGDARRQVGGLLRHRAVVLDTATGRATVRTPRTVGGASTDWRGHLDAVRSATFSPDGRTLAVTYMAGTVGLWNVATGTAVDLPEPLRGGPDRRTALRSYPDGAPGMLRPIQERTAAPSPPAPASR